MHAMHLHAHLSIDIMYVAWTCVQAGVHIGSKVMIQGVFLGLHSAWCQVRSKFGPCVRLPRLPVQQLTPAELGRRGGGSLGARRPGDGRAGEPAARGRHRRVHAGRQVVVALPLAAQAPQLHILRVMPCLSMARVQEYAEIVARPPVGDTGRTQCPYVPKCRTYVSCTLHDTRYFFINCSWLSKLLLVDE